MANEKVAYADNVRVDPRERMMKALAEFQTAVNDLPPGAFFRWQGQTADPMPAIMARIVAANYRQLAEDMEAYASHQTKRELATDA
jgi:hypothetical protein